LIVVEKFVLALVALFHIGFMILEMFFWSKPFGLRIFRQSLEKAKASAVLAANQGLYNGFLAAGLVWGLMESDPVHAKAVKVFFLSCVIFAGLYGAWSVNRRIFFVQAFPALVGLFLVLFGAW
jgi:putative membrane protein